MLDASALVWTAEDADAWISDDQFYRYSIQRRWDREFGAPLGQWTGPLVVDMLNPSTADKRKNDQTISRLMLYARRLGAGGLIAVNLYGYRATNPKDLSVHDARGGDIVGPCNMEAVRAAYVIAKHGLGYVVVAWGGTVAPDRRARIAEHVELSRTLDVRQRALLVDSAGNPCHPLVRRRVHAIPLPWSPI